MISLQQSLSIADSHYSAAAIARRNYVAAVDMTSLQQPLSATTGNNFAAVPIISLRQSLSIADSHYFAAAIAGSRNVAAARSHCGQPLRRSRLISLQQSLQPGLAAITPR